MSSLIPWPGMSDREYRALVERWQQNRLTWTAEDIKRLKAKVARISKREKP